MYKDYKIVVCTAAGRRRYMRYILPFVLNSDTVDRYDIWVHTHNCADIEFFRKLNNLYPKINLVWQPDGIVGGIRTINAFYKYCVERDTIYFKIDDDVVWMEDDTIEKMVDFRINHPDAFIVSPLVINNPLCTYLLQVRGKLPLRQYQNANPLGDVIWKSGDFAYELHDWFIRKDYARNLSELYIGPAPIAANRLSINAILWFGKDMEKIDGVVPGDDEEFLSCIYPSQIGAINLINGDCVVAHYAFFTQRQFLDSSDILSRYGDIAANYCPDLQKSVTSVLEEINSEEEKYLSMTSPYKSPANVEVNKSLRYYVGRFIPKCIKKKLHPEAYNPYITQNV